MKFLWASGWTGYVQILWSEQASPAGYRYRRQWIADVALVERGITWSDALCMCVSYLGMGILGIPDLPRHWWYYVWRPLDPSWQSSGMICIDKFLVAYPTYRVAIIRFTVAQVGFQSMPPSPAGGLWHALVLTAVGAVAKYRFKWDTWSSYFLLNTPAKSPLQRGDSSELPWPCLAHDLERCLVIFYRAGTGSSRSHKFNIVNSHVVTCAYLEYAYPWYMQLAQHLECCLKGRKSMAYLTK